MMLQCYNGTDNNSRVGSKVPKEIQMTVLVNPFVFGGTTEVKLGLLPEAAILVRFEVRDANLSVGMSRGQLAELGRQIDAAIAELDTPEPECGCTYIAA